MIAAVTGASGHVGGVLVRTLIERGHRVRALVRGNAPRARRPRRRADTRRRTRPRVARRSLPRRGRGRPRCRAHLPPAHRRPAHRRGERRRHRRGARRLPGSRGCGGSCTSARSTPTRSTPTTGPSTRTVRSRDESPVGEPSRHGPAPYDLSKAAGERLVRDAAAAGLEAVILNPTAVIGPLDYKRSMVGRVLLALARGRLPALIDGGFDWVDVRDVAASAATAVEQLADGSGVGAHGARRYLLPGRWASMAEVAAMVAETTGVPAPRWTAPGWLARVGVAVRDRRGPRARAAAAVHERLPRRHRQQPPHRRRARGRRPRPPAPPARGHRARHACAGCSSTTAAVDAGPREDRP